MKPEHLKQAIREVLAERRIVFARLATNQHSGGRYWDPIYNNHEESNELIELIALRAQTIASKP